MQRFLPQVPIFDPITRENITDPAGLIANTYPISDVDNPAFFAKGG